MEKRSCEDHWAQTLGLISQPSSLDKEVSGVTGCTEPWGRAKSEWSSRGRLRKPEKPHGWLQGSVTWSRSPETERETKAADHSTEMFFRKLIFPLSCSNLGSKTTKQRYSSLCFNTISVNGQRLKKDKENIEAIPQLKRFGGFVVVQGMGAAFGLARVWQEQLPDTTVVQISSVIKWKFLLVCIDTNDIALNQLTVPVSNNCKMTP